MRHACTFAALACACLLAVPSPVHAVTVLTLSWDVNQTIPDASANGLVSSQTISTHLHRIDHIEVYLETAGGWPGDLFAYLNHDSGFSVLLNRIGRTASNPSGLGGETLVMQVTLSDDASTDIHQATAFDQQGQITGHFQPSARASDPAHTLDTSERSAFLADFQNLDPNGQWVLYVADVAAGDQTTLVRWGITVTQIPEPRASLLLLAVLAAATCRRRRI